MGDAGELVGGRGRKSQTAEKIFQAVQGDAGPDGLDYSSGVHEDKGAGFADFQTPGQRSPRIPQRGKGEAAFGMKTGDLLRGVGKHEIPPGLLF